MPKPPTNNYIHHCCRTWTCSECFLAHEHFVELCHTLDFADKQVGSDDEETTRIAVTRTDLVNEVFQILSVLEHTPYNSWCTDDFLCHRAEQQNFTPRAPLPNPPHRLGQLCEGCSMPKPPTNNYVHHCCRTMACNECFLAHEHAIDLCHTLELIGVLNEKNQEDVNKIIAIRKDLLDEYFQIQHVLRLSPYNHWWNVDFLSHRAQQRSFRPHAPVNNLPHRLGRVCEGICGENSSSSSSS
ncbi:hypothetical protein V9T40_013724 [Parthenolecanium corni]|uniref:Uncharacterized protein n=1 Tax=Parthenolecanium corni TaxID=536013 RepID=A0AAN9Y1I1_9HEMI